MKPLSDYDQQTLFRLIRSGKFNDKNCFEWQGTLDKDGYGRTAYSPNQKRKIWPVSRLIYYILIGKIPEDMLICHYCDNPKCFNVSHLFLGSQKDNAQDRQNKGRGRKQNGENNHRATLTERTVLEIRKMYADGYKVCELVKHFNLKQATISKIINRQRWIHI